MAAQNSGCHFHGALRGRKNNMEQLKKQADQFLQKFAVFIIATTIIYFFCVTFINIPESGKRYADIILGALIGSGFTTILSFYWGSSKGSSDKNETIQKIAGKPEKSGI